MRRNLVGCRSGAHLSAVEHEAHLLLADFVAELPPGTERWEGVRTPDLLVGCALFICFPGQLVPILLH